MYRILAPLLFPSVGRKQLVWLVLACFYLGLPNSQAEAEPVTVNNEAAFLDIAGDVDREGFESFPTDYGCINGGASPVTTLDALYFSVETLPQDGGTSFLCTGTSTPAPPGPTQGANALVAGSNTGDSWNLDFDLTSPIDGVYFELTDAVERGDAYILAGQLSPILVASQGSGGIAVVRFGIIFDEPITSFTLINTGRSDGWGIDNMIFSRPATVLIDIKPGSDPNSIQPLGKQSVSVGIYTTDTFDALQIDPLTTRFGPGASRESHERSHPKDLDDDGDIDLVLHFKGAETGISCGDTTATLTAVTFDGQTVTGTDTIVTVNCGD